MMQELDLLHRDPIFHAHGSRVVQQQWNWHPFPIPVTILRHFSCNFSCFLTVFLLIPVHVSAIHRSNGIIDISHTEKATVKSPITFALASPTTDLISKAVCVTIPILLLTVALTDRKFIFHILILLVCVR